MTSSIVPCLRYEDAHAMIAWLCDAFGFNKHLVVEDGNGGIAHAQLVRGSSMIMLGSEREDVFGGIQSTPRKLGGTTQSPYLVVADADTVYAKASSMGAQIVIEIKDEDYGGRGFSCRDPEGHVWNIGTYDPWAEKA